MEEEIYVRKCGEESVVEISSKNLPGYVTFSIVLYVFTNLLCRISFVKNYLELSRIFSNFHS